MTNPSFNKWKSSTIYGSLSVRDLTNSSGSSVVEVASIDLSGNFLSRGDSTFTKKVICNASVGDINANNILTTKEYVDSAVSGGSIIGTANEWTNTNSFNSYFPTSTLPTSTSITNNSIVNKGMNDTLYSSITNQVKTNVENTFTEENIFNGLIKSSKAIDQDFTLPSGNVNKFTYTNFLEDVQFGMAFSQDGTDTNSLDNLTLGTGLSTKGLNLIEDAGITQSGEATNTLHNLTLGQTGLSIKDFSNTTQIQINTTNYITLGDTDTIVIDPITGIKQNYISAVNEFKGATIFHNDLYIDKDVFFSQDITQETFSIDQTRTLPSGKQNKFINSTFLEGINTNGITQSGSTTTNTLHNLTISNNLTTQRRINLTTDNTLSAPTSNQLGHFTTGTFSTSAITSNTQTNLSQISLSFGIYMVVANVVFQSNATTGTISKYQIGFNNTAGTAFTSCITGYGGNSTIGTSASNTTQLSLTISDIISVPSSVSQQIRVIANITYATTTMSINTGLCKFVAVRIA